MLYLDPHLKKNKSTTLSEKCKNTKNTFICGLTCIVTYFFIVSDFKNISFKTLNNLYIYTQIYDVSLYVKSILICRSVNQIKLYKMFQLMYMSKKEKKKEKTILRLIESIPITTRVNFWINSDLLLYYFKRNILYTQGPRIMHIL